MNRSSVRDADLTRARLLQAARGRFKRLSFEDVTLRDIASDAGVDASLINRYFGAKESLYREAFASLGSGLKLLDGPREDFGEVVARAVLDPFSGDDLTDGILIIMRAIGSPHAIEIVKDTADAWNAALQDWIGRPDAEQRAFLITSLILGVVLEYELRGGPGSEAARSGVRTRLARTLQDYLEAD